MKRLFRPRNLIIIAIFGVVVFAVMKKKQEDQKLAAMSDDQVREMVHDRVGGKVDAATEAEIAEKVVEKKDALASSSTAGE
jgi:hypothetical protein